MASEPQLVVALEARLDKFEKQLKQAGVIADRAVSEIEDRFSKANPVFAGTFLGNFLSNVATAGARKLIGFVEDLVARFRDLEKVSKLVNIEMNSLFGLQEAGAKLGVPIADVTQSVRKLAELLDQMKRGEENSLSKLFDANPEALKGINREALTFQQTLQIVADLVQNARTEIQKIDLAKAAGQAETLVPLLEKGGAAVAKLQKAAADSAPDLQLLANRAKEFDEAWNTAINNLKAYLITGFADAVRRELNEVIDLILSIANLTKGGIFKGGPLDTTDFVKRIEAARDRLNFGDNFNFETAGGQALVAGPRDLTQRRAGDVAGGGTTTRNPNASLSNVPSSATAGSDRDRFDSAADRIEKRTAALDAENRSINLGTEARERAKVTAELETVAKQINGEVTDEQRKRIDELAAAYGRAAAAIEQARSPLATFARESENIGKQLNTFAAHSLNGMTDALADVVTGTKTAKEAFSALAKSIINDLAKIVIRQSITGPLAGAIDGLFPGGPTFSGDGSESSMGGGFGGAAFGGGRASGGPVSAGTLYPVGEHGMELFRPNVPGTIIPNDVIRNGGGGSPPIIVNLVEDSSRAGQVDRSTQGGGSITAYVDKIMAENIARPGSATNNTLRGAGVRQPVARR